MRRASTYVAIAVAVVIPRSPSGITAADLKAAAKDALFNFGVVLRVMFEHGIWPRVYLAGRELVALRKKPKLLLILMRLAASALKSSRGFVNVGALGDSKWVEVGNLRSVITKEFSRRPSGFGWLLIRDVSLRGMCRLAIDRANIDIDPAIANYVPDRVRAMVQRFAAFRSEIKISSAGHGEVDEAAVHFLTHRDQRRRMKWAYQDDAIIESTLALLGISASPFEFDVFAWNALKRCYERLTPD